MTEEEGEDPPYRRSRVRRIVVAVVAAAVVLALVAGAMVGLLSIGAGVVGPGPDRVPFAEAIARSRSAADAPAELRDRRGVGACGDVVLGQGESIPARSRTCLAEGADGPEGRELAVAAPTVEGDPIVIFYRTGPGIAGVDVFADSRWDSFGGGGWSRSRCATPTIAEDGGCL